MADGRARLDQPKTGRAPMVHLDADTFGQWTERIARFLGTGRYLAMQTIFVIVWISFNVAAVALRFDPYPFILLNLAFSTQAAYAAPLILLAQNRQDDRDRVQNESDRREARESKADLDYLAREIAAIRMALGEVATRDFVRSELSRLEDDKDREAREAREKARRKAREARAEAKEARAEVRELQQELEAKAEPERPPAKSPDKAPHKSPEKSPDKAPEKASDKVPEKVPDKASDKASDKAK